MNGKKKYRLVLIFLLNLERKEKNRAFAAYVQFIQHHKDVEFTYAHEKMTRSQKCTIAFDRFYQHHP